MPPSILVRREVSASLLSTLFPNRFEHYPGSLYDALVPKLMGWIRGSIRRREFYINDGGYTRTSFTSHRRFIMS